jgi:hypothetical protein
MAVAVAVRVEMDRMAAVPMAEEAREAAREAAEEAARATVVVDSEMEDVEVGA